MGFFLNIDQDKNDLQVMIKELSFH
jgi:hypothetical protein